MLLEHSFSFWKSKSRWACFFLLEGVTPATWERDTMHGYLSAKVDRSFALHTYILQIKVACTYSYKIKAVYGPLHTEHKAREYRAFTLPCPAANRFCTMVTDNIWLFSNVSQRTKMDSALCLRCRGTVTAIETTEGVRDLLSVQGTVHNCRSTAVIWHLIPETTLKGSAICVRRTSEWGFPPVLSTCVSILKYGTGLMCDEKSTHTHTRCVKEKPWASHKTMADWWFKPSQCMSDIDWSLDMIVIICITKKRLLKAKSRERKEWHYILGSSVLALLLMNYPTKALCSHQIALSRLSRLNEESFLLSWAIYIHVSHCLSFLKILA